MSAFSDLQEILKNNPQHKRVDVPMFDGRTMTQYFDSEGKILVKAISNMRGAFDQLIKNNL